MLKELRDLLMKIVNDIDSGNSNIDESQTIEIASAIGELVSRYNKPKIPNKLTRLEACRHLRVSETKFYMLRRKGLISEGTKKAGDVRKWSIEELDKYIKENCYYNKDDDKSEKILLASFFFVYLQQFKCLTFKI